MNIEKLIALIKAQLNLAEEDQAKLDAVLQAFLLGQGGDTPAPEPEMEMEVGQLSIDYEALAEALKAAGFQVPDKYVPPADAKPPARPPYASDQDPDKDKKTADLERMRSIHVMRHGEIDDATSLVMREVYEDNYVQLAYEQEQSFLKWMRTGRDDDVLHRQVWGLRTVQEMLKSGLSVSTIRATMVEGMDELGGIAVPPQMNDTIIKRIAGLTAVRGGGALVIQTASNMVEWIRVSGGNDRYPSSMRGSWGDETTAGTGDNFEIDLPQIPVNIYSYPVDFSRSLLEDAANLESVFIELVGDTLAIDEDEACLVGNGAKKPRGLLPNSTNTDSLTEVITGHASQLKWSGLKALRRGIASQYRLMNRASWIGNSDTGSDIECLQDGEGRDYVEALTPGEVFPKLRGTWRESEAMPDVAASAYPLIFGDLSGYAIVERLGMAIDRFHDSGTGTKKYRFEIYRRVGGRIIQPWKFAVQKVSAS